MQTSSQKLNPQIEADITEQFTTLLADFKHPLLVKQFLADFLTETELSVFAKRLAIVFDLYQGKSYQDIKKELKVSSATISSVAEIKDKKGIKLAIDQIIEDQKFEKRAEKLIKFIPF